MAPTLTPRVPIDLDPPIPAEFRVAVEEALPDLHRDGVRVFYLSSTSPTPGVEPLLPDIEDEPPEPVDPQYRAGITPNSTALYIFTSGTTGATCVLRAKFSASQFWDDCRRYNVTVIQYVGELIRYLCNTPKRPDDREHGVRAALGNGLRADVWREFLQRFGPIAVWEFYGATEGNAGFVNYTGKIGAVGRANVFLRRFAPYELIEYDVEEDEPVRDERGLCIPVYPGDTGLLVIKITKSTPFHGYMGDTQKTEKKILRDVLVKGENVATTEVEATMATVSFIQEVNVYGVTVPGCEGRCGMAAVRLRPGRAFDGKQLYGVTSAALPAYAAPRFLRIQDSLEVTGTFKQRKTQLVRDGFDPGAIADPLFIRDDSAASYVPLTHDTFAAILDGKLNL
ncbi:hypothetical protein Q9966_015548 [Columba livia]|nr:hypothetical protein Q9966_015548 [Columba livia]